MKEGIMLLITILLSCPHAIQDSHGYDVNDSNPIIMAEGERSYHLGMVPTSKYYGNYTGKFKSNHTKQSHEECGEIAEYVTLMMDDEWYNLPNIAKENITRDMVNWMGDAKPIVKTNFWNTTIIGELPMSSISLPIDMPRNTTIDQDAFATRWIDHCENLTDQLHPDFFIIGERVNDFWTNSTNPSAINNTFQDFLHLCNRSTKRIHSARSDTKTVIEFDLCGVVDRDEWWMVENVTNLHCDLISFVSHPYNHGNPRGTVYSTPDDMPDNYYSHIRNHTQLPVAFTGVSWSSGSLNNSHYNFTGTVQDQSRFLDMFIDEVSSMSDVELIVWDGLHDLMPTGNETSLDHMTGLRYYNGTVKVIYQDWNAIYNLDHVLSSYEDADTPDRPLEYDPSFSLWMGLVAWLITVALIAVAIFGINKLVLIRNGSRCDCTGDPNCDCDI